MVIIMVITIIYPEFWYHPTIIEDSLRPWHTWPVRNHLKEQRSKPEMSSLYAGWIIVGL